MPIYDSSYIYITSASTLREKITRVDAVIDALMTSALKAAATDQIQEYTLNDGQTTIKEAYRGAEAVLKSVEGFERIRNKYISQLNGRVMRLVDGKNFRGGFYGSR